MAIGRIDDEKDIQLYLEDTEINKVADSSIGGFLVHNRFPSIQGGFSISLEENVPRNVQVDSIGRDFQEVGYWEIEIDHDVYKTLQSRDVEGLRYSQRGSKIHFMHYGNHEMAVDSLEFYQSNKEEIRKELEPAGNESIWYL